MWELIPRGRKEVGRLRRDLDSFFDLFLEDWPLAERESQWWPSVDVVETEDKITVKAEIPGVEPEDLDVSLVGDTLTIKGRKKHESEEKDEKRSFHRVERSYGSFVRSFRLPAEVKPDKVAAVYKDGILTMDLPKSEQAKARKIEISTK